MTAEAAAIEVERVSRWYGNVVAVNDVSFTVQAGITGLVGPNGAGKSTLLQMIAGFLRPSAGTVQVFGRAAWADRTLYRRIGIVLEHEAVYGFLSGYDFVRYNARLQGLADAHGATLAALREVDLEAAMHRRSGDYSKGMTQRLKVAAAIVHAPEILLLDEPFNGADPRQRLHLMAVLRAMAANGRTILFSSHILEEMERLADTVLVVFAGRLAAAGEFRAIRRLMTDRPHVLSVHSDDDRRLAAALMGEPCVRGVDVGTTGITVRTEDLGRFAVALPRAAHALAIQIREVAPLDESLERVFEYLASR